MVDAILTLARESLHAAALIAFLLAFGESLAFISLIIPATFLLAGFAAVLGAGGVDFAPIWMAAGAGAALGFSFSYWIGSLFKERVGWFRPFGLSDELLARARVFIERHGIVAVFLGHFIGPARAGVPIVAGMLAMRQVPFQTANLAASFLWAAAVLAPGQIALPWLLSK